MPKKDHSVGGQTRSALISMLGKRHHPKFKLDMSSPKQANEMIEVARKSHINIASNSFTIRSPDMKGTRRAVGDQGTPYEAVFETTGGTLYKEVSPVKMDEREPKGAILFSETSSSLKIKQKHPGFFEKPNKFNFVVNSATIKNNDQRKRVSTQKKVAGFSAQEAFHEFGAQVHKKQGRGSHYHLAHRQGYALGGEQSKQNLDLSTAGANYSLLFYIEDPIHQLMMTKNIDSVTVEGLINDNPMHDIPESIDYTVSFPQGTQCKKRINLLEYRIPSVDENTVAALMLEKAVGINLFP